MDCNKQPVQFVDCCTVMNCINIDSSDNSVTVNKSGCGVDLKITPNNINELIETHDGECIKIQKEFINNKLVLTPILDFNCIKAKIGTVFTPPPTTCPAPVQLTVTVV